MRCEFVTEAVIPREKTARSPVLEGEGGTGSGWVKENVSNLCIGAVGDFELVWELLEDVGEGGGRTEAVLARRRRRRDEGRASLMWHEPFRRLSLNLRSSTGFAGAWNKFRPRTR